MNAFTPPEDRAIDEPVQRPHIRLAPGADGGIDLTLSLSPAVAATLADLTRQLIALAGIVPATAFERPVSPEDARQIEAQIAFEQECETRARQYARLGRLGAARLRKRQRAGEARYAAEKAVADELETSVTVLQPLIRQHRARRDDRIKRWRNRQIIRLTMHGHTIKDIARRFDVHPKTAASWKREALKEMGETYV